MTVTYTGAPAARQPAVALAGTGTQGAVGVAPEHSLTFSSPVGRRRDQSMSSRTAASAAAVSDRCGAAPRGRDQRQGCSAGLDAAPADGARAVQALFVADGQGRARHRQVADRCLLRRAGLAAQTVALSGTGTQAVIDIAPCIEVDRVAPDTAVGTTSPAQTITVSNSGDADAVSAPWRCRHALFAITQDLLGHDAEDP